MTGSIWLYPALFFTGLAAGLVDSISGGGGLITLPVLLSLGLPPTAALGTNKFQSSFGSFTAAHHYTQHRIVDLRDATFGILCTLIGTIAGAWSVQQIHPDLLSRIIPVLLVVIALYTFFTPKLGEASSRPRIKRNAFYLLFGLALGFYDGFFGPGVGSFWAFAFVIGLGFSLTKATGYTKVMNFTSNIVSAVVFLIGDAVWFKAGIAMAAGQIVGAKIGSTLVVRSGAKLIRPIFITIVILTTLKLVYSTYFP